jgi:hypothetical protein
MIAAAGLAPDFPKTGLSSVCDFSDTTPVAGRRLSSEKRTHGRVAPLAAGLFK